MAIHRSILGRSNCKPLVLLTLAPVLALPGCATRDVPMTRASGNTAYVEGRYDEAVAYHQRVVEAAPGRAQYQYELGRALRAQGDLGRASEHLAIAHGLDPRSEEIVRAYAETLVELQRVDVLEDVLLRRAQRSAQFDDYLLLGEFLGKAGDPDGQEQALLSAADLAGQRDDEPQRALARFYESTNRPGEAIERWKMVLWFDVLDAEAGSGLRRLGDVPGPTAVLVPQGRTGLEPRLQTSGTVSTPAPPPPRASGPGLGEMTPVER